MAITLKKKFSKKFDKSFLDIYMRNVVSKFQSWGLNGAATIAITYIDTQT